jgi:hypothetical protein
MATCPTVQVVVQLSNIQLPGLSNKIVSRSITAFCMYSLYELGPCTGSTGTGTASALACVKNEVSGISTPPPATSGKSQDSDILRGMRQAVAQQPRQNVIVLSLTYNNTEQSAGGHGWGCHILWTRWIEKDTTTLEWGGGYGLHHHCHGATSRPTTSA